jgi:hypothetical protein
MSKQEPKEKLVVAHTAGTATEALVIRGLLESAGIPSPDLNSGDPFPMREVPEGATHGTEVFVPASRLEEARRIIEERSQ